MKKIWLVYPFLFAIYPVFALYSRNMSEIQPWELARPLAIMLALTTFLFWILGRITKDSERAAFLSGILIFMLSASELVYRYLYGILPFTVTPALHGMLVLVEIGLIALFGSRYVWQRYLNTPARRANINTYMLLLAALMLGFVSLPIIQFWSQAYDDAPQAWSTFIGKDESPQALDTTPSPDIYYIILDGYGRQDVLEALFEHDNRDFLQALQARGFFIGEQSHSNYPHTSLSITSSLNMQYLSFATELAGENSSNRIPLFELINNNRARKLLEQAGYKTVLIDSGSAFTRFYDADYFITPFDGQLSLFESWFYSTTALNALYAPPIPHLTASLQNQLPLAGYNTHRTFVIGALEALARAHTISGKKFIFAHIIAPHPPFLLGENGEHITPAYPYLTGDGGSYAADATNYQNGYIGQVKYLNQRVLQVIDDILQNSPQPPIIILQGDHGPGLTLVNPSLAASCPWERVSIFNAYYFPEQKTDLLYPEITPVNTFRVVFNTYFQTNFELLPDKTYATPFIQPYKFIDITERINVPCMRP
jgi:hypothetical protein